MAGRVDVDQMLDEIPASVFWEWIAYNQIDPFVEERADWRSAKIAQTVANFLKGKRQRSFKLDEFKPRFAEPKKPWRDILAAVVEINAALGGDDLRDEEKKGLH